MEDNMKTEETVTISKAEYESLKQQVAWLMEQLKLSKRRQFGTSSEKSEYDQISIFNGKRQTLFFAKLLCDRIEPTVHFTKCIIRSLAMALVWI